MESNRREAKQCLTASVWFLIAPDGRLLSADEVWADVPESCKSHFQSTHISQGEHPVLGVPFYFVHPCNTASVMGLLHGAAEPLAPARDYLLHWLSWVAPLFHIPVPMTV